MSRVLSIIFCTFLVVFAFSIESTISFAGDRYKNRLLKNFYTDHPPVLHNSINVHTRFGTHGAMNMCVDRMCEEVEHYPAEEIARLIDLTNNSLIFHGSVIEPFEEEQKFSIDTRINPEESFCKSVRITITPKGIYDVNNKLKLVASKDGYEQSIVYETCGHSAEEKPCYGGDFLLGFETKCKPKFSIIKLVVVSEDQKHLEYARLQVPVACVCKYMVKEYE